jgi:hypothetical protein
MPYFPLALFELAEGGIQILGEPERVAAAAPVGEADVQQAELR